MLACRHRRRAVGAPRDVEPAVVPAPPDAVPAEVADAQVAVTVAVDRAPEEDVHPLPVLGDEVGVREVEVEDARVQDRLVLQLLAELIAFDAPRLLLLREVQRDLGRVDHAALGVLLDGPAVGDVGRGVAVDQNLLAFLDRLFTRWTGCHRCPNFVRH